MKRRSCKNHLTTVSISRLSRLPKWQKMGIFANLRSQHSFLFPRPEKVTCVMDQKNTFQQKTHRKPCKNPFAICGNCCAYQLKCHWTSQNFCRLGWTRVLNHLQICPPQTVSKLVNISPISRLFMILTSMVTGIYEWALKLINKQLPGPDMARNPFCASGTIAR